jgi:hypothetical protein
MLANRRRVPIRIPLRPSIKAAGSSSVTVDSEWLAEPGDTTTAITTDLHIENLESRTVEARISFVAQSGRALGAFGLSLEPLETMDVPNVLEAWFGTSERAGTLSLEPVDAMPAAVLLSARSYVRAGEGRRARAPVGIGRGEVGSQFAAGLAEGDGVFSTIEAFNASPQPQTFSASLRSRQGALIAFQEDLRLLAGETREWSLRELFPQAAGEGLTLELSAVAGSALPLSRVAVTDLRTGTQLSYAPERPASLAYLPIAGRTAGAGDTYFSSDLALANPVGQTLAVRVRFLQRDLDNAAAPTATLLLSGRETRTIEDALGVLFGLSEVSGFLEIDSDEPGVALAARKTARSAARPGTVGDSVQAIRSDRFSTLSVLRMASSSAALPSLVGLLNPAEASLPVVMRWLDQGGRILAESVAVIPARSSIELSSGTIGALGAQVLILESDGRHFAFPGGVGRIARRSGDGPARGRSSDDILRTGEHCRISASDRRIGTALCRIRSIGR